MIESLDIADMRIAGMGTTNSKEQHCNDHQLAFTDICGDVISVVFLAGSNHVTPIYRIRIIDLLPIFSHNYQTLLIRQPLRQYIAIIA